MWYLCRSEVKAQCHSESKCSFAAKTCYISALYIRGVEAHLLLNKTVTACQEYVLQGRKGAQLILCMTEARTKSQLLRPPNDRRHLCILPLSFFDTRPIISRLECIAGLVLGRTSKIHSDISLIPPLIVQGVKSAIFCLDFRQESHLTSSGFETEQDVGIPKS